MITGIQLIVQSMFVILHILLFIFITSVFGKPVSEKDDVHLHLYLDDDSAGNKGDAYNIKTVLH